MNSDTGRWLKAPNSHGAPRVSATDSGGISIDIGDAVITIPPIRICKCGREPLVQKRQRKCWRCKDESHHRRAMDRLVRGKPGRFSWKG